MRITAFALAVLAAACAHPPDARVDGTALHADAPATGHRAADAATAGTDSSRIARLEREARAIVRTDGCRRDEECRAAPVGSRACGGPRTYLPYCSASTDTAALAAKLAELKHAEDDYNRQNGLMSTCEFRRPPPVMIDAGSCKAAIENGRAVLP
jgi:hypothetical protein